MNLSRLVFDCRKLVCSRLRTATSVRSSTLMSSSADGLITAPVGRLEKVEIIATVRECTYKAYIVIDEDAVTISYQFGGKQRNMKREKDELLERSLTRIQLHNAPKPPSDNKRAKKKQKGEPIAAAAATTSAPEADASTPIAPAADFPVFLYEYQGTAGAGRLQKVQSSLSNVEAWPRGSHLQIGDAWMEVEVNPPTLVRLALHPRPMVGYPLRPYAITKFADVDGCVVRWLRKTPAGGHVEVVANAAAYTPSSEDLGCSLVVECTPAVKCEDGSVRRGLPMSVEVGPVEPAPALTSASVRIGKVTGSSDGVPEPFHAEAQGARLTRTEAGNLRVMTYNLLADQYASQVTGEKVLFSYCNKKWLDIEYRKQLCLEEIRRFQPDLLCLQEVDEKAFREFYQPHLTAAGYGGFFTNKAGGKVREGSAMFFRTSTLSLGASRDVNLRELFSCSPLPGALAQFQSLVDGNPKLAVALTKVTTIGQVALLRHTRPDGAEKALVVVNTHLFFHPRASHIRTMHTAALLEEAAAMMRSVPEEDPTLIFCGDLNSDLNDGLPGNLQLMMTGGVDEEWWDWRDLEVFGWGGDEEEEAAAAEVEGAVPEHVQHAHPPLTSLDQSPPPPPHGVSITTPARLRSSCGLRTPYTNFTRTYTGLLDYVLVDPTRLEVVRSLPFPTEAELKRDTAIPSSTYPSDHMAVVTDLRWRSTAAGGPGPASEDLTPYRTEANVLRAEPCRPVLRTAAAALSLGNVVAVPTDTLYGVACCANSREGVAAIYELKKRQLSSPLAICVSDWFYVCRYGYTAHIPEELLQDLLPGPFTVLVTRRKNAPLHPDLNPGVASIGIRVPDNAFIREVCREHDGALALTSANLSGTTSTLRVEEFRDLWPALEAVFDGGLLPSSRAGSTIVDLTVPGTYRIIREGSALELGTRILEEKHKLKKRA